MLQASVRHHAYVGSSFPSLEHRYCASASGATNVVPSEGSEIPIALGRKNYNSSVSSIPFNSSYQSSAPSSARSATPPEPQKCWHSPPLSGASSSSCSKRSISSEDDDDFPRKRFRCEPCERDFTTNRSLLRHQRESGKHRFQTSQDFPCSVCAAKFSRAHGRDRHCREQHGEGKIACSRCGKLIRSNAPHSNTYGQRCTSDNTKTVSEVASMVKAIALTPAQTLPSPSGIHARGPDRSHHATSDCKGVCFGKIGVEDSQKVETLCSKSETSYRKITRWASPKPPRPCTICGQEFEIFDEAALFKHLTGHLRDVKEAPYRCDKCALGFAHAADLRYHLRNAASGSCGYSFKHETACSGHHPRAQSFLAYAIFNQGIEQRPLLGPHERDSVRFALAVRNWEQSQLGAYSSTFSDLIVSENFARSFSS